MHSIITVLLLDWIPPFCFAVACLWDAADHTLNSFYLTGKDSFCRTVLNLIARRSAMEMADLTNNMVSTVPTNSSIQVGCKRTDSKTLQCQGCQFKWSWKLVFWDLSVQTREALKAFLRIPHIVWIGYPETHCALFCCFVLFLWFDKCFSLVSLVCKIHSIVFIK